MTTSLGNMDPYKARSTVETPARTLDDAIDGADIFLGLSAPGVLRPEMAKKMARDPIIFALANPTPEIMPEQAKAARPDAIVATGRSYYPNQVNNVLCFPFVSRGALDVGSTTINEEMKVACVKALADLTMAELSDVVKAAYGNESLRFGRDYLIPNPFDPQDNEHLEGNCNEYHRLVGRGGVSVAEADALVRGQNTVQAALLLRRQIVEGMICGSVGRFRRHLGHVRTTVGIAEPIKDMSTLVALILPTGTFFIADTHVTPDPTAEEVAEMTLLAVEEVHRFGLEPKVALLSHSSFGSYDTKSARKMRRARELLETLAPELE